MGKKKGKKKSKKGSTNRNVSSSSIGGEEFHSAAMVTPPSNDNTSNEPKSDSIAAMNPPASNATIIEESSEPTSAESKDNNDAVDAPNGPSEHGDSAIDEQQTSEGEKEYNTPETPKEISVAPAVAETLTDAETENPPDEKTTRDEVVVEEQPETSDDSIDAKPSTNKPEDSTTKVAEVEQNGDTSSVDKKGNDEEVIDEEAKGNTNGHARSESVYFDARRTNELAKSATKAVEMEQIDDGALTNKKENDEEVIAEEPKGNKNELPNGHARAESVYFDARRTEKIHFSAESSKVEKSKDDDPPEIGTDENNDQIKQNTINEIENHPEKNTESETIERDSSESNPENTTESISKAKSELATINSKSDDHDHERNSGDSEKAEPNEQIDTSIKPKMSIKAEAETEAIKTSNHSTIEEESIHDVQDAPIDKQNNGIDSEYDDDESYSTYVDDLPLFHYSRLNGSGLPNRTSVKHSNCSEFAVVRVDKEELASSAPTNASASTTPSDSRALSRNASGNSDTLSVSSVRLRQREHALLLRSDLWSQPHSIVAIGYGEGNITLTRLVENAEGPNDNHGKSPCVIFALPSIDLGGIMMDTSGHGSKSGSSDKKSYTKLLRIRDETALYSQQHGIVDMSFDSSGSILGAIDEGGHCCVWEFKYTTSLQSSFLVLGDPNTGSSSNEANVSDSFYTPASTPDPIRPLATSVSPEAAKAAPSMFSNFMSVLTGIPPPDEKAGGSTGSNNNNLNHSTHGSTPGRTSTARGNSSNISQSNQPSQPDIQIPALTADVSHKSDINYPSKWGPPTCLAIDPAYKRKRDKSIITGFANGQLYLTKKGTFFNRRNDTILYQAGNAFDSSYRGIETVVWRGPLVAFADATGIKLIDSDHLTRIAHIARPAGASPFLHPSLRNMTPSLFFETAQHVLVGWGDCLMQISVEEHDDDASSSGVSIAQSAGSSSDVPPRIHRTANCTMAWELDCVACDVVPLDRDHVVVLGLVAEDLECDNQVEEVKILHHDLEVQVLSRKDGTISYSDRLPLIDDEKKGPLSVGDFRLLSSFALPRMGDSEETKALRALKDANEMGFVGIDVSFDMNQPLFAGTDSFTKKGVEFKDQHLEWNVKSIMYDEDFDADETNEPRSSDEDNSSVDSDDYECLLRPIETVAPLSLKSASSQNQSTIPPTMVVCTDSDVILSLASTVDDAIEYSLENNRCALALTRGLRHKRQLRRYNLDYLINSYLEAVLRIPRAENEQDEMPSLSLRRTQLAVKSMPVLLGDKIELWERWTKELENIPGAVFLLRRYLPVRDPILPSKIYIRILQKMLAEVEQLSQNAQRGNPLSIKIRNEATKHFLESLIAWGPTKVLKEYISFYRYNKLIRKGKKDVDDDIRTIQILLQRRYLQTAAGYLMFPVRDIEDEFKVTAPRYEVLNVDTEDSLFDIEKAVEVIASRVPIVATPNDTGGSDKQNALKSNLLAPNNHICLEAMARLRMMQGEFDLALRCFLAIGACHATDSIQSFETSAIEVVNGSNSTIENLSFPSFGEHSYEFVMSMIERQELNQFLFEKDFLMMPTDSKLFMPIFALIRLVGLNLVGKFLMHHCVAAGFTYSTSLSEMNAFSFSEEDSMDEPKGILRRSSLPIDKVAEQLESSPAFLHWYLHLVFTRRPDFYVNFPTNSIPSSAVTSLHRRHFQLYVDYAGDTRDSNKVLEGIETYKVESKTTPLLTFLKAALPLGGIRPVDARRVLEVERSEDANKDGNNETFFSSVFALELAYIIEKYSEETETEALGILNLYLKGAKSLPLAVSYAQRQTKFKKVLWDNLISYCLKEASDGTIYGELLEAAALKGADLSQLVERIPPGMVVEGLRPRLVAAVADYRMKLEIYEAAIAAGSQEKIDLMREIGHRSRRGLLYDADRRRHKSFAELIAEKVKRDREAIVAVDDPNKNSESRPVEIPQKLTRTRLRRDHRRLVYSIPSR